MYKLGTLRVYRGKRRKRFQLLKRHCKDPWVRRRYYYLGRRKTRPGIRKIILALKRAIEVPTIQHPAASYYPLSVVYRSSSGQ